MPVNGTTPPLRVQDIIEFLQHFQPPYYLSDTQRSPWLQHPTIAGAENILEILEHQKYDTWQIITNPTTGPKQENISLYTTISIDDPKEDADVFYLTTGIQPHIRVTTKENKFQHHFLIEQQSLSPESTYKYKQVCSAISQGTKADGKAFANRWSRIPGTPRIEDDTVTYPTAVYLNHPRYSLQELYQLLCAGEFKPQYSLPDKVIAPGEGRHTAIRSYIMHRHHYIDSVDKCEQDLTLFIKTYIGNPDEYFTTNDYFIKMFQTNYLRDFKLHTRAALFAKAQKNLTENAEDDEDTLATVKQAHPAEFYLSAPEPLNSLITTISTELDLDPAASFVAAQKLLELLTCELYTDKLTSNAAVNCHILLAPSGTGKGRILEVLSKTIQAISEKPELEARKLAAHKIEGTFRSDRGLSKRMEFCGNTFLYFSEEFDDVLSKCLGKNAQSYQYIKDYFKTIYDAPTKAVSLGVVGSDTELTILDGARMPTIGCAQNGLFERYLTKDLYRSGLWNRFSIISLPNLESSPYQPVSFQVAKQLKTIIDELGLGTLVRYWWDTPKLIPTMPPVVPPVVATGTIAGQTITVAAPTPQRRGRPQGPQMIDNPLYKPPLDRELTHLTDDAILAWEKIKRDVHNKHCKFISRKDHLGADLIARLPQQVLRHAMALVSPRYPLVRADVLWWYYNLLQGYSDAVYDYLSGGVEETTEKDNWTKVKQWIQKRLATGKPFALRDLKRGVRPVPGTFLSITQNDVTDYVERLGGQGVSTSRTVYYSMTQPN